MTAPTPALEHSLALSGAAVHAAAPAAPPAAPAYQHLQLPSVDAPWRYAWAYGRAAWASLLGPHRLRAGATDHYSAPMQVSLRLAHRWRALFDVPARAAPRVPLLSNECVATLMQARLLADLGPNLRHVVHVRHRTVHHAGVEVNTRSRDQRLSCHVQRVLRVGEDRAMVEMRTVVHDAQGQLLSEVDDGFLIDQLPPEQLAGLPSDTVLMRELLGLRRRLPRLSTLIGEARLSEMSVPASMGRRYGRIAGNLNPVHCCRLGAWLMGVQRPCLQALALRNLVVRHLAELGVALDRLALTFAAPTLLGQTLMLVVDGDEIEVHDAKGHLVAFGTAGG